MLQEIDRVQRGPGVRPRILAWRRAWRSAEFLLMFVAAPLGLAMIMGPGVLFPALWALSLVCLLVLLRDSAFERKRLWNGDGVVRHMPLVFGVAAFWIGVLVLVLWLREPELLLSLPRQKPGLWAMIMVLYPVLSVYPQEVAFRAYFFHRYEPLFGRGFWMIVASAAVFSWAHIVMWNGWAILITAIGGVLFGVTYARSKSLAATCIEHAVYGCALFTMGWGSYFYSGAVR